MTDFYLSGQHDHSEENWLGDNYSEHSFELSGSDFQNLELRNTSSTDSFVKPIQENYGAQLSLTHLLYSNNPKDSWLGSGNLTLSYGGRFQQLNQWLEFRAFGDIFSSMHSFTQVDNSFYGPEVSLKFTQEALGWTFQLNSSLMQGYNSVEENQATSFGFAGLSADLGPGKLNTPLLSRPVVLENHRTGENSATLGEVRAVAKYPLSQDLAIRFGYTGIYYSDIQQLGSLLWSIPGPAFQIDGMTDLWLDQIHASIEWRR